MAERLTVQLHGVPQDVDYLGYLFDLEGNKLLLVETSKGMVAYDVRTGQKSEFFADQVDAMVAVIFAELLLSLPH